jgi:predicted RNA-binding Zn ribbon-like protein
MTGETMASSAAACAVWRERSGSQPGARPPAPGALVLVQSFINSHYDLEVEHGADLFATPAALADWLVRRGLLVGSGAELSLTGNDVRRALTVREGLRAFARANSEPGWPGVAGAIAGLNEAARGATVEMRFADGGPRFVASTRVGLDRALGVVLAVTARAMIDGSWARLKVCPGEHCEWAFYDYSRNQSGRWCSMAVCGGRAKARAYYRRRGGGE